MAAYNLTKQQIFDLEVTYKDLIMNSGVESLIEKKDWYRYVKYWKELSSSTYNYLPEEFLGKFHNTIDWYHICRTHQNLSEDFIKTYQHDIDFHDQWYAISRYQTLSEDFIEEFQDKLNWMWISVSQKLSEDFIRKFKDKVDWECISMHQKLSENFIREFKDKVRWTMIVTRQNVSKDFIKEMKKEGYIKR